MPGLDPTQPDICGMNTHWFLPADALEVTCFALQTRNSMHNSMDGNKRKRI